MIAAIRIIYSMTSCGFRGQNMCQIKKNVCDIFKQSVAMQIHIHDTCKGTAIVIDINMNYLTQKVLLQHGLACTQFPRPSRELHWFQNTLRLELLVKFEQVERLQQLSAQHKKDHILVERQLHKGLENEKDESLDLDSKCKAVNGEVEEKQQLAKRGRQIRLKQEREAT